MGVKLDKTYVIGTHVMWFEIEMYEDFIKGLVNLLDTNIENKKNVTIDLCFNLSEKVESIDTKQIDKNQLLANVKNINYESKNVSKYREA